MGFRHEKMDKKTWVGRSFRDSFLEFFSPAIRMVLISGAAQKWEVVGHFQRHRLLVNGKIMDSNDSERVGDVCRSLSLVAAS